MIGKDLHVFFVDNVKNWNLPSDEEPVRHSDGYGGFLMGVKINQNGVMEKFNLGEVKEYRSFNVRTFTKGEKNNFITSMIKKKKSLLFSLDIK
jgi:hypothetical protein